MNGEYLWEELNLTQNFNYKDVDDVYRNINSKDERKKYVWSILRDKYYSEVYKKYKDIDLLIKAGFFQNDLNIDEVDIYNLNLLTTPVSKIIDNIKNQKAENPVALLTTGGFCPLHEGHIYMMNMAKQRLEENGYNVIGGYFSQSHEDYVSTKPYYNTNRYENFAQCQEYLKDSDWLMADPWESLYVKTSINFTEVIERLELYLRKYVDKNIKVAYVFGGDNVEFMYCFENQGIGVCIDRYGCNKRFENMKSIIKTGNTFFIENNSNSSKLLSREIRKNEEKLHNENYDGVYLIRNEGTLPLLKYGKGIEPEGLEKIQSSFLSEFKQLLEKTFDYQMVIKTIDVKKQLEETDNYLGSNKTINLDSYYRGTYNLEVTRLFDISDMQKKYISLVSRFRDKSIEEQIKVIKQGDYTIVDDDSVSGRTLNSIKSCLSKDINIESTYLLSSQIKEKIFDVIDFRDFIVGAENSGLTVRLPNLEIIRVPYLLPYVCLKSRANIPSTLEFSFSIAVWNMNKKYISQINKNLKLKESNDGFRKLMNYIGFDDETLIIDICDWHINLLKKAL